MQLLEEPSPGIAQNVLERKRPDQGAGTQLGRNQGFGFQGFLRQDRSQKYLQLK